jgi:hypothetical protein
VAEENYDVGLGCWDSLVARRLMRRGPVELHRMFCDNFSLVRMVVEYKWTTAPDVKLARKLHRLLQWIKLIDPDQYKQSRKQVLADIKAGSNGDIAGYRAFVKLIDNPKLDKKNDSFINELIANSPKTEEAVLKLSERDNVLNKFGLDYRSDYIYNDSKKVDILLVKLACLRAFCMYGTELVFEILCFYLKLQSDKARLEFANILWPDYPDIVSVYEYRFEARQKLFDEAMDVYCSTMDDVRDVYHDSKKLVEQKYENIKKYKELIKSGQLPVFKKK